MQSSRPHGNSPIPKRSGIPIDIGVNKVPFTVFRWNLSDCVGGETEERFFIETAAEEAKLTVPYLPNPSADGEGGCWKGGYKYDAN